MGPAKSNISTRVVSRTEKACASLTWSQESARAERDLGAIEEDGTKVGVKVAAELDVVSVVNIQRRLDTDRSYAFQ